ncbi:MAG: glucosidase [Cyanobacteria bacterium P01_D01_bin.14]
MTPEHQRLHSSAPWKRWGPYLSERQWGTVREDYSASGNAWSYFPHSQSHQRAYRWGEDGLLGICDDQQLLCFGLALWNGEDPVLKERLFGLTGPQGNHGEDVKEYYFYLDATPTHSYLKALYKYPQATYPYEELVQGNRDRTRHQMEYELLDTGVFEENRYFDVQIEYAKAAPDDILIQVTVTNRGPEEKTLTVLPTLWFRNTWSWDEETEKPQLKLSSIQPVARSIEARHPDLSIRYLHCQSHDSWAKQQEAILFTENETNENALFGSENASPYTKEAFHRYVIDGETDAINPENTGTKAAAQYTITLPPGGSQSIRLRLSDRPEQVFDNGDFQQILQTCQQEADEFYQKISPTPMSDAERAVQRQAFAGLMWTKQVYHYDVSRWREGDSTQPTPPSGRQRNKHWGHLDAHDIISMPDKWEYPWFAAWDLAFHCLPLAMVDAEFAKHQLDIMTREWYMHPNGQLPAYEWSFGDVNPPVHAWATWRVYKIEQKRTGKGDRVFLERVFQKLLLNFTWWVNRKDTEGNNVFEGGFLGLDNIGAFNRSDLPTGGRIEQADGTSWMAMYCLDMLTMSLELAKENPVYEDMATKFFEHFLYIADAMNHVGSERTQLWDEEDGFFYDVMHFPHGDRARLKVRSMVGLIPLYAVMTLDPELLEQVPGFKERVEWFISNRPDLRKNVACMEAEGEGARRMLALCYATVGRTEPTDRLRRILIKLLDEAEFLSPYGIRALSKYHEDHPYHFHADGETYSVHYDPAESTSPLFGGNSNWRGPVWFPVNYLLIESLQKFHHYLGDDFKVECPTGSGKWLTLWEVASELSQRLMKIFLPDEQGKRPVYGDTDIFHQDPHWQDYILFYEYFHGDNGAGLGASHQTGWTGLVAKLIQQQSEYSP